MNQPDFERARQYALERLARELPATLAYHSLAHTRDEVAPAVERLAALEGIAGEPLLMLRTAAVFHDIGFVERRAGHEAASARIAAQVLPGFGYSPTQVRAVCGMILATEVGREPNSHLEQILADADLDVLGRADFGTRSRDLRAELEAHGGPISDEEWYQRQVALLETHRYHTAGARALREAGQQQNLAAVRALRQRARSPH